MKTLATAVMILAAAAGASFAQTWEFGGLGGGSFLPGVPISGPQGSATAGFQPGFAAGAYFGQALYRHISGEVRYEFLQSDPQLSSGGSSVHFTGQSHVVHYDVILHTDRKESPLQFFAAIGGGMRIFRGTGAEEAYQPLSQYGYFTRTQVVKPMASVGGGITYQLSGHVFLRAEFRDFITPFPTQIITPAPGNKFGSLLQNFVPMVGLDYLF